MRYAQIREIDISDGPGIRVGFYVQGCSHACYNCYNQDTWDFNGGKKWTEKTNDNILNLMNRTFIKGLSILGGDPICVYEQEQELLKKLLIKSKELYPDKNIWLWTGYLFDDIYNFDKDTEDTELQKKVNEIIQFIDIIVDGPYINNKHCDLLYRGSLNQRVIDVKKSIKDNKVICIN